jgi:hypothetical protein
MPIHPVKFVFERNAEETAIVTAALTAASG